MRRVTGFIKIPEQQMIEDADSVHSMLSKFYFDNRLLFLKRGFLLKGANVEFGYDFIKNVVTARITSERCYKISRIIKKIYLK